MKKVFDKIGLTGIIAILTFTCIFIYGKFEDSQLANNTAYTKGISLGINKGVRGSRYLYYSFTVDNVNFKSHVSTDFCKDCNSCCIAGDTVIVKYQGDDPQNNGLVTQLPKGLTLENSH